MTAAGLMRQRNWARLAACALALLLVAGAVPTVSSAVVDFRFLTLAREGAKVILGVLVLFYLRQPEVRAAFQNSPTATDRR